MKALLLVAAHLAQGHTFNMGVFADGNTYGLSQNLVMAFPILSDGAQMMIASV
jgi:hypothetical protein